MQHLIPLVLLALTPIVSADVFNNYDNARVIQSTAVVPPDGRYVFSNAGNGQIIHHDRNKNVPNIYPAKFVYPRGRLGHRVKRPQLALRAHNGGTKWISLRTPVEGQDSTKCISAQWDDKTDGGADHAGTLYECVVDPLDLAASLEKTKQWWILMPVKSAKKLKGLSALAGKSRIVKGDTDVDADDDDDGDGDGDSSTETGSLGKQLSVKSPVEESTKGLPFWNTKTNRMEALPQWKYDKRSLSEGDEPKQKRLEGESDREGADSKMNVIPPTISARDHGDHHRSHVAAHKLHSRHAAPTKLGPFYVVSVDHLYDMETRVLSSESKKTIGNQRSVVMKNLDPDDKTQQWYLELK